MKRSLIILLGGILFFFVSSATAEELILEFDPDEEVRSIDEPAFAKQYIEGYRQLFEWTQDEIAGLEAVLVPIQKDISSLDTQLQVLSLQMERMKRQEGIVLKKIQGLEQLQERFRIQGELLALEMKDTVKKFERMLTAFFRVKTQFVNEEGRVNLLQLFTHTRSPSEVLFQDYLLQALQNQLTEKMQEVEGAQGHLGEIENQLNLVHEQLRLYQERLQGSAEATSEQVQYQQKLLGQKKEEQQFFLQQLEESRQEQIIIAGRIQQLATGISPRDYERFPAESFLWSVAPALGISSFFHDEQYQKRFGIEHNAIDIPTDQLTPVKAALSGRVVEVHDGGLSGYSYLQLAHRDGFSTVYGHIFSSQVQEGDIVKQGQVIALSGGALGTKGAGRLTTGPHVHFELLKNGVYVNPLEYLPKMEFPKPAEESR